MVPRPSLRVRLRSSPRKEPRLIHTTPPVHLRLGTARDEKTEKLALRAVLTAARLLGVATGTHLRHLRDSRDPLTTLQARLQEAELHAHLAWEAADILRSRFPKIPEKHRPYLLPPPASASSRSRTSSPGTHDTAQFFLVCSNTIFNWEAAAKPESRTVGSPLEQTPPVRRAADVVRSPRPAHDLPRLRRSRPRRPHPRPRRLEALRPLRRPLPQGEDRPPPPSPAPAAGPLTPSSPASSTTPG